MAQAFRIHTGIDRFVHLVNVLTSEYCVDNYQQYLAKNPFGYRCHANTGVRFPAI